MTIKAMIDEELCLGYGDCVELAPEAFELDEVARVIGDGEERQLRNAARKCPAEAISLFDKSTGQRIDP